MEPRLYTASQTVPRPRADVFAFFSDAQNLEAITPPWLSFRMVHRTPGEMRPGTELTYRLKIHGIPVRWVSRITEWVPDQRFVDEQIRGPYAIWHHTHTFEEVDGGTRIDDLVRYRLPVAPLGDWIAGWLVARDVRRIFDYRRLRIAELLTAETPAPE
jgi:ligand-binding SRPBCC domain-containing protein